MTDKRFKKLSRSDLVDIIYQLQKSEKKLKDENEKLRKRVADRDVKIEKAGSIADAVIELDGLFKAAQATADDYLLNVARLQKQAEERKAEADAYYKRLVSAAYEKAREILINAQLESGIAAPVKVETAEGSEETSVNVETEPLQNEETEGE